MDRIGHIAGGFGSALVAPFGLIADLATAPWRDEDDYDGFVHTITARGAARGGQFLGGLFGPNTGVGAAVGAIPEDIRNPIHTVAAPVGHALETVYREGIGEPLSTFTTAAGLATEMDTPGERVTGFFDPATWKQAYKIAQHRSPGQAIALGLMNTDITDAKQVAAAQHSDGYKLLSGTTDAITRFFLDPTVIGGKAVSAAHLARTVKPITATTDFNKVEASSRFGKFNAALEGKSAAEIRHQFFPNHEHGAVIAATLADAGDAATRAQALRLFMGDYTALETLRAQRADIAGQVERLTGQQSVLHSFDPGNFTSANGRNLETVDVPTEGHRLYRRDVKDSVLDPEARPQGTYYSLVEHPDFVSPFGPHSVLGKDVDVGDTDFHAVGKTGPDVLEVEQATISHARFDGVYAGFEGNADTGVSALKMLVPPDEFERLRTMTKADLLAELKDRAPRFDWSKITKDHDAYDMLSAYGAVVAREHGYSALILRDAENPNFSEYVALSKSAVQPRTQKMYRHQDGQLGLWDEETANVASDLERNQAEIDALMSADEQLARRQSAVATITAQPRVRAIDTARTAITRSETFQSSTLAVPVRRAVTMRPHGLIDLNRPDGDTQIQRLVKQIGLSPEHQDAWRGEYMRANSPAARADVVTRLEDAGIRHLADQAGMSEAEVQALIRRASEGRDQAAQVLKSRVYDGEGRSLLTHKDDADGTVHEVPLLVSQTANVLPLTDFAAARKALSRVTEMKQRFGPAANIPGDALDMLYSVWKPSVLLRVGWPIRVVGDEQMRILAKVGAMAQMRNFAAGLGNVGHNMVEKALAQAEGREAQLRGIGFDPVNVKGYSVESAFGDKAAPNAYYTLASSHHAFRTAMETEEQVHLRQLRGVSAEHRSIKPDEVSYGPAWLDAVNNQIGRDPLARIFLNGGEVNDGVRWLRTPEGARYVSQIPERRRDLTMWAGKVKEQVESYTMSDPLIMQNALKSKASLDDLFAVAPDASARPLIHGQVLAEAFGKGFTAKYVQPIVQKAYTALGSVPTDTLSRHPFFDAMYRQEATRRTNLLHAQAKKAGRELNADDLAEIAKGSREYALGQTRHLLYDLQEQSDLAHTLRFIMPFYSAWQETMTRWAGLAVENPAFVARMRMVWNAPEKAGIITDENGTPVDWHTATGSTVHFDDGTSAKVGKERYVTLPLPKWAQKQFKGLRQAETVRFNKRSANLVLQGAPGFGPAVQVPVNEIVKNRPDLATSLKAVLPFGAQQSTLGALMPATLKRLDARAAGDEDRSFHNAAMRIYFDQLTDYNLGKRDSKPQWSGALKQARAFYNIRAVASFISPVAPGFQSPYQPYIDAYRRLRSADPQTADQKFLDQYGPEYFALTQSLSKSVDGVPPTVEAFGARGKYKDLIEKHPDLGGLIVGSEGSGAFSNSVYQAQLASKVAPGSEHTQRETLSFEVASIQPDVRLGWIEYGKAMDLLDAAQHQRGLPNLRVKGAQDLALLKTAITNKLMADHPSWAAEFQKQDRGAMERRLTGLRDIAKDDRLAQRPEIAGLRDYMAVRKDFRNLLAARESGSLDATSNTDIAAAWESITSAMAERNPAFAALFHRFLDRDNLEAA